VRAITIGERTIARELFYTPRSYSSVQDNLRSLSAKLAIDIRQGPPNAPKTYLIYSYEEILRRRRKAGLTHYRKRASAVELLNADTTSGAPTLDALEFGVGAPNSTAPPLDTGAPTIGAPSVASGAPTLAAHIRNRENTSLGTASPTLVAALRASTGRSDDNAATQIARDCRAVTPDVTDEEIAYFIHQEAPAIINNKHLDNPMGVLIRHIPRCCSGESLRQHRETMRRQQEFNQQRSELERARWRETAHRVLEDTEGSADERRWALAILGEENS
jgi:hypothetical protein